MFLFEKLVFKLPAPKAVRKKTSTDPPNALIRSMEEDVDSLNRHKARLRRLQNARIHRDDSLLNTRLDLTLPW